jgi:hypothetical protein
VPDFRIAEVSLLGSGYVGSGTYRRGVGRAA